MGNNIRNAIVVAASAMLSAVVCANTLDTLLSYNSTSDELQGYASHFVEAPEDTCATWENYEVPIMKDTDGTPDGYMYLCSEVARLQPTAKLHAFITNPSANRSTYAIQDLGLTTATIYYLIENPASGSWLADADHYMHVNYYSCPCYYVWSGSQWVRQVDPESCNLYTTSYDEYLGPSSDSAFVN